VRCYGLFAVLVPCFSLVDHNIDLRCPYTLCVLPFWPRRIPTLHGQILQPANYDILEGQDSVRALTLVLRSSLSPFNPFRTSQDGHASLGGREPRVDDPFSLPSAISMAQIIRTQTLQILQCSLSSLVDLPSIRSVSSLSRLSTAVPKPCAILKIFGYISARWLGFSSDLSGPYMILCTQVLVLALVILTPFCGLWLVSIERPYPLHILTWRASKFCSPLINTRVHGNPREDCPVWDMPLEDWCGSKRECSVKILPLQSSVQSILEVSCILYFDLTVDWLPQASTSAHHHSASSIFGN
jgi:hypothetical protein